LLLLIFVPAILSGQPTLKDSADAYEYWAQRGIIEMIYAYMQDYFVQFDSLKNKKELAGYKLYKATHISGIDSRSKDDLIFQFQLLNQYLIDNNWKTSETKILRPLQDKYHNQVPLDEQFFSVNEEFNTYKYWNERKQMILANYGEALKSFHPKPVPVVKVPEVVQRHEANKEEDEDTSSGVITILISLVSGILIGAFSIYIYSRERIYSILFYDRSKYDNELEKDWRKKYLFKYIGIVAVQRKWEMEKRTEINAANKDIDRLKTELDKLKDKNYASDKGSLLKTAEVETAEEDQPSKVREWKVNQESLSTLNEIYYTIPEHDGSFKVSNGKRSKEVDCFYKIEIDKNRNRGQLHFMSGDYDLRALDNIDYYINPVCEIENITERTQARRIIMRNPGVVILNGENWKIDAGNKVKIRLI